MDEFFNTQAAADFLHSALPDETAAYWSHLLINNRRNDREPLHKIPFNRIGKAVFYTREDLAAFVDWEKGRRLGTVKLSSSAVEALRAFGIGEEGGGAQGRRFKGASVNRQVASDGSGVFVQLIIDEPLMVFALTPDQAVALGMELVEAGGGDRHGVPAEYQTVADNDQVKITRRTKK